MPPPFPAFALLNVVKLDLPELTAVPKARRTDLFSVRVLSKVLVRDPDTEHRSMPKELEKLSLQESEATGCNNLD